MRWPMKPLAALVLVMLLPALAACTTAEGTNALVDPGTFEREVMDTTLQGLDIIPPPPAKVDKRQRTPLVLPKQMAQLPPPTKSDSAALPVDSNNPQISTAGLSQADLQHLRNARVIVEFEPQTRIEGDIQQLEPDFPVVEFFRIVQGEVAGRESDAQVTVFDSVGFALEDFSSLRYVHDLAREHAIGEHIHLVPTPANIKNLYQLLDQQPAIVPSRLRTAS